jgi:hypothetical protein
MIPGFWLVLCSDMMKSVMTCNIALYAITLSLDTTEFSWICCLLFYGLY